MTHRVNRIAAAVGLIALFAFPVAAVADHKAGHATPPGQGGTPPGQGGTPPGGGHTPITICHMPGTPAEQTMTVPDQDSLDGHLVHGDTIGACTSTSGPPDDEDPPNGEDPSGGPSGGPPIEETQASETPPIEETQASETPPIEETQASETPAGAAPAGSGAGGGSLAQTGLEAPVLALLGLMMAALGYGIRRTARMPS